METRQPIHFYNMYLVRTKGLKSIIYRIIHNTIWDSIIFMTDYNSIIGIDNKGIFFSTLPEYKKKYNVISMKKTSTYFIEENVAYKRFINLKNNRKPLFYDYRNLFQNFINTVGKVLNLKFLKRKQIKNEKYICICEFIVKMFDVSDRVSYTDKSISWFEKNDIYKFLKITSIRRG